MVVEGQGRAYAREIEEIVRRHTALSFMACYEAGCWIHKSAKEGARYFPEDHRRPKKSEKSKSNHQSKTNQCKPKEGQEVFW